MKNRIKYTFIIPAYNSQQTIKKCLDNICEDIKEVSEISSKIEIIVVENGSSDSTEEIVKDYIKNSEYNVRLIHSEKGVSKARNAGLISSSGEMIIFVDSDDIWLRGSLKEIDMDYKKNDSDLFVYSFLKGSISEDSQLCSKVAHNLDLKSKNSETKTIEFIRAWMISRPTLRMQVWAKVFKSDLIKKNKIFFNEDIKYSEDSEFVIRYSKFCKKIYVSSHSIYKYIISPGSTMRSVDHNRINEYIKSMKYSEKVIRYESTMIKNAFKQYVLIHLNIILVHDVFIAKKNVSFRKDYKMMKNIIDEDIFKSALKNISLKECCTILLLPELFMKIHLNGIVAIMCYIKSYINHKQEMY